MASPCIDVCRHDEATGWCLGCGMTRKDRKRWKKKQGRAARPPGHPRCQRPADRQGGAQGQGLSGDGVSSVPQRAAP
jgi:hypothetical protein